MADVDASLHVVTPYSNPMRWKSRLKCQLAYEEAMIKTNGVELTTVECQYGNRAWDLPDNPKINRVRVRAKTICWNKENLINIGITRLPPNWEYLAWVDGDVTFRKATWATDAVHALQHYDVIQPWSDAYDLGPDGDHLQTHKSFCCQWWNDQPIRAKTKNWWEFAGGPYAYPHSGYAWCMTRTALNWVGCLFEQGMSGSGDHHMALGMVGEAKWSLPGGVTPQYEDAVETWQNRAVLHINGNIGYLAGSTVEHMWHGRKIDRSYNERWSIIVKNKFNPLTDIKKNTYGVYELCGNKPTLSHQIDQYFRSRNEDTNTIK